MVSLDRAKNQSHDSDHSTSSYLVEVCQENDELNHANLESDNKELLPELIEANF